MLSIIDKYIIGKYLKTFFFTLLIFTMITIVIDFSEKIDNFMDEKAPTRLIIWAYYANFIPFLHLMLFPVYNLIAVIFFTSRMAYNSEIISILNGGVSFTRILRPYLIGASIIGCIMLLANHFFMPTGNKTRIAFENRYIYKYDKESQTQDIHIYLTPTSKAYIRHYSIQDSVARDLILEHIEDGELKSKLVAKRADYDTETEKWRLTNYTIRSFNGRRESYVTGVNLDTTINLTPGDLERRNNLKMTMTSPELSSFLKSEKKRGTGKATLFQIELYQRTANAFTILILTCIGMVIAARKIRGGTGLHLALGALIGSVYIMFNQVSTTLSTNANFHPMLGAWTPNILFLIVFLFLLRTAQK
jgi:lipopolysaccharide export system permease protein